MEKDSEEPGRQIHRAYRLRSKMATLWKCPKCKIVAEIRGKTKRIKFKLDPGRAMQSFPTHRDCELVKPIYKMDFSKLIKVGGK